MRRNPEFRQHHGVGIVEPLSPFATGRPVGPPSHVEGYGVVPKLVAEGGIDPPEFGL